MPYLTDDRKSELAAGESALTAGDLTFEIQQSILTYLGEQPNYQTMAEVLGALEGAKADFIERVLKPYEAKKRIANGDVWPAELTGEYTLLSMPEGRIERTQPGPGPLHHMGD